ncbi:MAG: hypothetical protein A2X12_09865 [Bacteroidetes bacterium GWE2_29_8]|nr:MAG: hypothetical protein A2X12_09865 [Bacteroidetes bacterium GWE2_29_8]OFY14127.1 MAG: hypothetical protein A2X02_02525 [Bacteroidetes bacterium GWF2_29_10]
MINKIKHIGLQIKEQDIKDFYIDLLGCDILNIFVLSKEDASNIFGILEEVNVIYAVHDNIELELFVSDTHKERDFNHLCIYTNVKNDLINKVKQTDFFYHIREKANKQTLFVRDSNNNIFEFKDAE